MAGFQVIMYGRFWVFTEAMSGGEVVGSLLAYDSSTITIVGRSFTAKRRTL